MANRSNPELGRARQAWNYTISPNTYPQIARLFADGLLAHKITKYHSRIAPVEKWRSRLVCCAEAISRLTCPQMFRPALIAFEFEIVFRPR